MTRLASPWSRRRTLSAIAAASAFALAGCIGATRDGAENITLRLHNESSDEETVTVTFERDGEVAFEETYTLGPTQVEEDDSILEATSYEVTAETDRETAQLEYDFVTEDCNKWVSVSFNDDGEMALTQDAC